MFMLNVAAFGHKIDQSGTSNHMQNAGTLDVLAGLVSTVVVAGTAFAAKKNIVKPRWIWSITLVAAGFAATHFTTKETTRPSKEKRGWLIISCIATAILATGIGIGLAPPTSKILSTNLRIGLTGLSGPAAIAAIAVAIFVTDEFGS